MLEDSKKVYIVASGKYYVPSEILMAALDRNMAEKFAECYRHDLNHWEDGWGVFIQECDLVIEDVPVNYTYLWTKVIRRADEFVVQETEYIAPTVIDKSEDVCSAQYSQDNETLTVRTVVTAMNKNDALKLCREKRKELLIKHYQNEGRYGGR